MRIDEETNRTTVKIDEVHKKTIEGKIITKRSVDDAFQSQRQKPNFRGNRHRRSPQMFQQPAAYPTGSFPQQANFQAQPFPMNPYQNPNFGFSQQSSNGNALGQSQNPLFNQNAGANTHSSQSFNPFGNFQNNGGSSMSANLANNGLAAQVSAANTDQQSYLTAQGAGQQNNALSQSANFDPFGNLQTTSTNAGNLHTIGLDGERNQANGVSNAHNQNPFGNSDSGAQTLTESFEGNGVSGQKATSSSHSSQINNYENFGTNPVMFPLQNPGVSGGVLYGGYPQQGFGRLRRSTTDAVVFPQDTEANEKDLKMAQKSTASKKGMPEKNLVEKSIFDNAKSENVTSNSTKSENEESESLDSRFGLPGHPVRTFLRETLGGLFNGHDHGRA